MVWVMFRWQSGRGKEGDCTSYAMEGLLTAPPCWVCQYASVTKQLPIGLQKRAHVFEKTCARVGQHVRMCLQTGTYLFVNEHVLGGQRTRVDWATNTCWFVNEHVSVWRLSCGAGLGDSSHTMWLYHATPRNESSGLLTIPIGSNPQSQVPRPFSPSINSSEARCRKRGWPD